MPDRSAQAGFQRCRLAAVDAAERCEDIAIVVSEPLTNALPDAARRSLDARSGSA